MRKLFAGRCASTDCAEKKNTVDVWSESVDERTGTLVDATCQQCHGALQRVFTSINIGGRSGGDGGCKPDRHVEGCPVPALKSALEAGRLDIVVVRHTPVQGVGGMVN